MIHPQACESAHFIHFVTRKQWMGTNESSPVDSNIGFHVEISIMEIDSALGRHKVDEPIRAGIRN
jgi:hypothetical protein